MTDPADIIELLSDDDDDDDGDELEDDNRYHLKNEGFMNPHRIPWNRHHHHHHDRSDDHDDLIVLTELSNPPHELHQQSVASAQTQISQNGILRKKRNRRTLEDYYAPTDQDFWSDHNHDGDNVQDHTNRSDEPIPSQSTLSPKRSLFSDCRRLKGRWPPPEQTNTMLLQFPDQYWDGTSCVLNSLVPHFDNKNIFKTGPDLLEDKKEVLSDQENEDLAPEWHACMQQHDCVPEISYCIDADKNNDSGGSHVLKRVHIDVNFGPVAQSLDGRKRNNGRTWRHATNPSNKNNPATTTRARITLCHCGLPATAKTVQSDGPNYGRFYLACGQPQQRQKSGRSRRRDPVVVVRRRPPFSPETQHPQFTKQHQQPSHEHKEQREHQYKDGEDAGKARQRQQPSAPNKNSDFNSSYQRAKPTIPNPYAKKTFPDEENGIDNRSVVNCPSVIRNPYAKNHISDHNHSPRSQDKHPNHGDEDHHSGSLVHSKHRSNQPDTPSSSTVAAASLSSSSPPQRRQCTFFQWDADGSAGASFGHGDDPDDDHDANFQSSGYETTTTRRLAALSWQSFGPHNHCCLFKSVMGPAQVQQGAIGNCWFLSALAVVAEKPYLIQKIMPHRQLNAVGCYQINLYWNGAWKPFVVDSFLPVIVVASSEHGTLSNKNNKDSPSRKQGRRISSRLRPSQQGLRGAVPFDLIRRSEGGHWNDDSGDNMSMIASVMTRTAPYHTTAAWAYPAFCGTPERQLWPALVEKAYAKAHGSYTQLAGGFIAEGLFDLTGAPTETIVFVKGMYDDNDALWRRLLEFHQQGFIMGVATARGGDGLVGGHAYSILDVVELNHVLVGEQSKMTDFFTAGQQQQDWCDSLSDPVGMTSSTEQRTTVRLVRIRNPWGKREWKGAWSAESDQWTRALRNRLGNSNTFAKGDGTFYMSFGDMLERFHHLDVAKTRPGWHHGHQDGMFRLGTDPLASSNFVYRFKPDQQLQIFISVIQLKKRAETTSKYWHRDASMLILKRLITGSLDNYSCNEVDWSCASCVLSGVKRVVTCQLLVDPNHEYCCFPFSCLAGKDSTNCYPFRISTYSSHPVKLECLEQDVHGSAYRAAALTALQKDLLSRDLKLVYPVAYQGALVCVHAGEGCLYFVGINGASDHYLSVRLVTELPLDGGILQAFDASGATPATAVVNKTTLVAEYDIAPRSQRILAVLSRSGTMTTATELSFRYMASIVFVPQHEQHPPHSNRVTSVRSTISSSSLSMSLGSHLELHLVSELIIAPLVNVDQTQLCGGDTVDAYLWIPQIGAASARPCVTKD